jgi:hypothetical protein
MAKKPNLSVALQRASGQTPKPAESAPAEEKERKAAIQASREGKKAIVGYFDPAVSRQLKQIALDEETNLQDLLKEAINDLFLKKGKPAIA